MGIDKDAEPFSNRCTTEPVIVVNPVGPASGVIESHKRRTVIRKPADIKCEIACHAGGVGCRFNCVCARGEWCHDQRVCIGIPLYVVVLVQNSAVSSCPLTNEQVGVLVGLQPDCDFGIRRECEGIVACVAAAPAFGLALAAPRCRQSRRQLTGLPRILPQ